MYIIFDEENKEMLRYFASPLPKELEDSKHIFLESEDLIPAKEGYTERAVLKNGEIEWTYTKIEEPVDPANKIAELESQTKVSMMGMMEVNARLRALESKIDK